LAPNAVEQRTDLEPIDHGSGSILVQRRHRQATVPHDLHEHTTRADKYQRTELRVASVMFDVVDRGLARIAHPRRYETGATTSSFGSATTDRFRPPAKRASNQPTAATAIPMANDNGTAISPPPAEDGITGGTPM
jgi:hypothetical protein